MKTEYQCNQCGDSVPFEQISMQFNAGHGVVTVCVKCKPPGTAAEIIRDMNDFMSMTGGTPPVDIPQS